MGSAARRLFCFLALCCVLSLTAQHALTKADLALLKGVTDAQISPDGALIAYTRTSTDYAGNTVSSEVVLVNATTGQTTRAFPGSQPRWAPNGRSLAFRGTSPTQDQEGLWIYDLAAAGPRYLTSVETTEHWLGAGALRNFAWSPDSSSIAYVAADAPLPPSDSDVRDISKLNYKTRTGFTDGRKTHIWIVPASGGAPKILTPGLTNEHSLAWSPDGRRIAFISNHSVDPESNYNDHIFLAEVPSGVTTQLTRTAGTEFRPAFSPDGNSVAYLGWSREHNTRDSPAEDTQLWIVSGVGTGTVSAPRKLSAALDRRITDFAWNPTGRGIYCLAGDRGTAEIYRIAADRGTVENITSGNNTIRQFSLDSKGVRMAWVQTESTKPPEVYAGGADGRGGKALTHDNEPFTRTAFAQDAEPFWFDSFDGVRVQGWVMKPVGLQNNQKYPTVLYVHGGPHGMYGFAYSERFQLLAAQGYGVVFINPRGSSGYGQAFSDGSVMNWGGGDYKDLMAGLDYAQAHNAWIDREKLGVIGGSYGGFMTNWIVTQTRRFKAAISIAGVSDLISFYGTSLYPDLIEAEFNGMPWNNWELLWQWSPLSHVKDTTTPVLLLHGEADNDVPITQAEEMYTALKKMGVPTTLVRYPKEGHGLRQPHHITDMDQRITDWLAKYLRNE
jgi:dipeptidyl aminopeptidase/acylaminoacyl peptidase